MIPTSSICVFLTLVATNLIPTVNSQSMTDTIRMVGLNTHNELRSTVAKGNAVNKDGSNLPKATNMYKMSWSRMVESYALDHVQTCNFSHNYINNTSNNLFISGGSDYADPAVALEAAIRGWYGELETDGQNSLLLSSTNYNHFTQVVWAKSKEIGCAVGNCEHMHGADFGPGFVYTYVVCDYSPGGNYLGQYIYESGSSSASNCPSGSTAESSSGLCKINGVADIHA